MPQLFGPASNTIAKVSIAVVVILLGVTLAVAYIMDRGHWMTSCAWRLSSRFLSAISTM